MAPILVLIDHRNGEPRTHGLQLLAAARDLAASPADVAAVWLGPGGSDAAADLGAHGVETLYHLDTAEVHQYVTVPQVEALQVAFDESGADTLLFASTNHTKDVAARLGIRLDAGVITDVTGLRLGDDGRLVATKEVFGGDVITTSKVAGDRPQLIGIAANAFTAEGTGGDPATPVALDVQISQDAKAAPVVEVELQAAADRPDIGEARVVVVGGRGLGSAEAFDLLEQFADALDAGVGATRAVTDAGWYPHRYQIGQTGRTIAPVLYLGVGVSGAIQHRAGMQTAKYVVVINKDAGAPIFEIADFGIVGDLHQVVPRLIELLEARAA